LKSKEQLRSYVTMLAHGIEKGLALPDPRPGFGDDKVQSLLESLATYLRRYGSDPLIDAALCALEAYVLFNQQNGLDMAELAGRVGELRSASCGSSNACPDQTEGGTREVLATEIHAACCFDLSRFFESRFSVRQFSGEPVGDAQIGEAIRMAQKTPSVCNRQPARVHVFKNDALGARVLACQQGNRGFGDRASNILIVTSELGSFLSVGERNQCWIDGGMFAMSLVYALHSKGLGTCCLNWSVEKEADQQLRSVTGIKPSESIIMLIAVGHLPDRLRVASSPRRPLDQIARFHFCPESTSGMPLATPRPSAVVR
jgi:nitroreductase